MFSYGKFLTAAIGAAALSGTTLMPATRLFAAPAVAAPMIAIEAATPNQTVPAPDPVEPPAVSVDPAPVAEPAEDETQAPAEAEISARELECMTRVILYEAGSEVRAGQVAVAQVVMNRKRSGRFPSTVCGVIHQRGQFSSIRTFSHARNARWNRAEALARAVMAGEEEPVVGKALYFHATRVSPAYVRSRTRVGTVGNHVFYR